ncbi:uncharacterized protein LOC143849669 isoform X3 [Tasmannia lanceolata]|uniref:uncharacterized protein LOC143849669 isoform X3 n=1 Tax=Tasmannia lanceolata TaxID=3420 RepID=UPI004063FAC6
MEASALSMPIPPRKEWRAVSEHTIRNAGMEDLERVKSGHSDERTIYEQGMGSLSVDFCSITIDGGLSNELLQQRLHSVSNQREELQHMEIELRAQVIASSEILEMQKSFDSQIKEQVNAATKLKEQLQEREQCIRELEIKMEEKDMELRAIKIDSEAVCWAWAKEDLLREQNKELATFRRERDNTEAERSQHLKQIHDLQEHIHEKESQYLELEEQHRVARETVLYRDEQLRETQAWAARVQEMQSTAYQSFDAELRERTEHFNQIWLGWQRQFAEMERHHMQAIQQLQLELAEARERNGMYTDNSQSVHASSKDVSPYVENKGNQFNGNEGDALSGNSGILPNGNLDRVPVFVSDCNASTKNSDRVPGVQVGPPSILGLPFIPPGQVTALHPFVMHPQGVPQSLTSANLHVPQTHVGHFQPLPPISSHQHWQNQQGVTESSQIPNQTQYQHSQIEQSLLKLDAPYDYELSADGQVVHSEYQESHISPQQTSVPTTTTSSEELEVLESNDKRHLLSRESHHNLQESSSQFHNTSRLGTPEQKSEPKQGDDENMVGMVTKLQEDQLILTREKQLSDARVPSSTAQNHQASSTDARDCIGFALNLPEVALSAGRTSSSVTPAKTQELTVLDESSLLACIVRAIPAGSGGRIRISTTLPNRLGKMLAPLHWHDYKKQYGKLDDFVSRHPELFVIEGDYIHLREGAQAIISATTAVAKVAAAAAVSAPYSSSLPTVAVTPVAHAHRPKKIPPIDSNGVSFNIVQGLSNVKILSKSKDHQEQNGVSKMRTGQSSVHVTFGNGVNLVRTGLTSPQNNGSTDGRHDMNLGGKPQGRGTGLG